LLRGRVDEAEAASREVHQQFLVLKMDINAALVALDLAVLLSEQGRRKSSRPWRSTSWPPSNQERSTASPRRS